MLEGGLRLSSAPIRGGRVLWVEDISELLEVTADLADKSEYLTAQVLMRQKEVETRRKEQALAERNRLYDKVIGEIQGTIALFSQLTDQLERCSEPAEEALLTARLAVVCIQIKRSVNLVFIEESQGVIYADELLYALKEWLTSLRLAGVQGECVFELEAAMDFSRVLTLYDTLTRVLLTALDGLRALFIRVGAQDGAPRLRLDMTCRADLSVLAGPDLAVEQDDEGEWTLSLALPRGGGGT